MTYYPIIKAGQNTFKPPSWVIEPIERVSGGGISGLMEHRNDFSIKDNTAREIPVNFYGRELATLATGTDEEIAKVSAKFGLLTSPFSKTVRIKQNLDRAFGNHSEAPADQEQFSVLQPNGYTYDYCQVLKAIEVTQAATSEEIAAIYSSIQLTQALQDAEREVTGIVVSFSEIRVTASRLLDAVKVITSISGGVSITEMSEQIGQGLLPSFPVQRLRYIEYCLEGSNLLGISLALKDKDGNNPHPYEVDPANYAELVMFGDLTEVNALRQWNLMLEIDGAHPRDEVCFTEALALGIRNLAVGGRTWAYCDHCRTEFPLSAGQLRDKGDKKHGTYCSNSCRNAAAQKRYRENQKRKMETDTSTQ